jgi:hypothetical protein
MHRTSGFHGHASPPRQTLPTQEEPVSKGTTFKGVPKSDAGERTVALDAETVTDMTIWRQEQDKEKQAAGDCACRNLCHLGRCAAARRRLGLASGAGRQV